MTEAKPPRGWVSMYYAAFTLMLAGAAVLVVASLGSLSSLRLLWLSSAFSAAALLAAVASVVAPRGK